MTDKEKTAAEVAAWWRAGFIKHTHPATCDPGCLLEALALDYEHTPAFRAEADRIKGLDLK